MTLFQLQRWQKYHENVSSGKEEVVAYFKVLSRHSPAENEE
jgi:predicted SnoaL-like aldol condensation-catalyzing enzyme